MAEIFPFDSRTHFEESSLQPLLKTEANPKIPSTHFEKSSLATSQKEPEILPSKPPIPSSFSSDTPYQVQLVKCAEKLDRLQKRILQFDTVQIEKSSDRAQRTSLKIFEINTNLRHRQMNASKWATVTTVANIGLFIITTIPLSTSAMLPAVIASFTPLIIANLKTTLTSQKLVNDAYLLQIKAEKTRLERELQKEIEKQSHMVQNSSNNAFKELEEQVHQLAIALDKQTIHF